MKPWTVFALVVLLFAGCRGGDDDDDIVTDGGGDASLDASSATIFQVQQGDVAEGTLVTLTGVVVTAVDTFAAGGMGQDVFVQDPVGGEYSGVQVRGAAGGNGLVLGDIVTVEGSALTEFSFNDDATGRSNTQLVGGTIKKTGGGSVPDAELLVAWELADEVESEKWEGVLVRVDNVAVVSTAREIDDQDETYIEFKITGPLRINSGMTSLSELELGDCFASVSGVLSYAFDYKLIPRSAADLASGGECIYEGGLAGDDGALCTNEGDDDHDGFSDCDDIGCQQAVGDACFDASSIAAVQEGTDDGTVLKGARVRFASVVVTAVSQGMVWVADAAQGAQWNGIALFNPARVGGGTITVGSLVNVRGTVDEFFDATQLSFASIEILDAPSVTPVPVIVSSTNLASGADAEAYEGVLVRVENVTVTTAPNQFGEWVVTGMLNCDDKLDTTVDTGMVLNLALSSLTGVIHYDFGKYRLLPRGPADIVVSAE